MEITVPRDDLHEAVTWAARNLPSRPALPVLTGIRLDAARGQLLVSVFDYETSARTAMRAAFTDEEGSVLVPGKQLLAVVKSLPKKPADPRSTLLVTLTRLGGGSVEIACGDTIATVTELPLGEYPALPDVPGPLGMLDAQAFRTAAARVAVAAGRDDTLPALTCIMVTPAAGTLTFAATDRYRLAEERAEWTALRPDMPEHRYLVPAKALAGFAKNSNGRVTVGFSDGSGALAAFADETRILTVRTQAGDFPRYGRMFRDEHPTEIIVDTAQLASTVKTCGDITDSMTDGKTSSRPVRLTITDGQVKIEAVRAGALAAHRIIPALLTGDEMTIWFDAVNLAQTVAVHKGSIRMSLIHPEKPAQIMPAVGTGYRAVVMPLREPGTAKPKAAQGETETTQDTAA